MTYCSFCDIEIIKPKKFNDIEVWFCSKACHVAWRLKYGPNYYFHYHYGYDDRFFCVYFGQIATNNKCIYANGPDLQESNFK